MSLSLSAAHPISNVLQIKHAEIEVVSILALLIDHAVHLQYALLEIIKQLVNVLQVLRETLTDSVTKVSSFSISNSDKAEIAKTK